MFIQYQHNLEELFPSHLSFIGETLLQWTINYQKKIIPNSHNITEWVLQWKLEFCSGEMLCSKSLVSVQYLRSALLWLTASLHRNDTAINHINSGPTNQEQKNAPLRFYTISINYIIIHFIKIPNIVTGVQGVSNRYWKMASLKMLLHLCKNTDFTSSLCTQTCTSY